MSRRETPSAATPAAESSRRSGMNASARDENVALFENKGDEHVHLILSDSAVVERHALLLDPRTPARWGGSSSRHHRSSPRGVSAPSNGGTSNATASHDERRHVRRATRRLPRAQRVVKDQGKFTVTSKYYADDPPRRSSVPLLRSGGAFEVYASGSRRHDVAA